MADPPVRRSTDKVTLSGRRPPRRFSYRETPDVAAAVVRLVSAIGKRVADGDPEDLAALVAVERAVAEAFTLGVDGLRATGRSDGEIGRVLGVSKQAVAQRWPRDTYEEAG